MKKLGKLTIFTLAFFFFLATGCVFAGINRDTPWEFETNDASYNPIIGTISGVSSLQPGDYIGAFDENGTCYGANVIKGDRYGISLVKADPGSRTDPLGGSIGDMPIPGFNDGDKVIFRLSSGGVEYILEPESGGTYIFRERSEYPAAPPMVVNLVLAAGEEPGEPGEPGQPAEEEPGEEELDDDEEDDGGTSGIIGGIYLPIATTTTEGKEEEPTGVAGKEETEEAEEEGLAALLPGEEMKDDYRPPDYYSKEPKRRAAKVIKKKPTVAPRREMPAPIRVKKPRLKKKPLEVVVDKPVRSTSLLIIIVILSVFALKFLKKF